MRIRELVQAGAVRLLTRLQRISTNDETEEPRALAKDPWKDFVQSIRLDVHETARPVLSCFECNKLVPFDETANVVRSWLLGAGPACEACGQPINGLEEHVAYSDLRAAAGHIGRDAEPPDAEVVSLPIDDADPDLFAVRVSGTSIDGGRQPLRDGDLAIMRLARHMPASAVGRRGA